MARKVDRRGAHTGLVGRPEGKRPFGRLGVVRRIMLNWVRKQLCMDMAVNCQLYITCQLHVSANVIFGHHQVGYSYRMTFPKFKMDL